MIIQVIFAAFGSIGFGRSLAALLWMSTILTTFRRKIGVLGIVADDARKTMTCRGWPGGVLKC